MKTTLRTIRTWFLALALGGSCLVAPTTLQAREPSVAQAAAAPVLAGAWYQEIMNSRGKTIQGVFILLLLGAFMLRRSS